MADFNRLQTRLNCRPVGRKTAASIVNARVCCADMELFNDIRESLNGVYHNTVLTNMYDFISKEHRRKKLSLCLPPYDCPASFLEHSDHDFKEYNDSAAECSAKMMPATCNGFDRFKSRYQAGFC